MGVLGLWQILDSIGHPIKIEGLEGKRLGVDANVWLYKFIRGFREKDNASCIDSHKLGLFNRVSKLLFYKIKPIFVFDGPAPVLKRRTLERRQNVRNKHLEKAQNVAMKVIAEQLKERYPGANFDNVRIPFPDLRSHNLVAAEKFTDEDRELFYLPPEVVKESDDEDDDEANKYDVLETKPSLDKFENPVYHIDSDDDIKPDLKPSVDIHSEDFAKLPAEIRYEILHDIKEARRRIRRVHALPEDAGSFSNLQLERLRSRRMIQEKIEECERDICSAYTGECDGQTIRSFRMQSDATSTMLYVQNKTPSSGELHPFETEMQQSQDTIKPISVSDGLDPILKRKTLERHQNVRNMHSEKATDVAVKVVASKSKEPYPEANLDNVNIPLPDLRSHPLVAAEKITVEDKELSNSSPEVVKISDDEADDEANKYDVVETSPSLVKFENTICLIDSDDDELDMIPSVDTHSEESANPPAESLQDTDESRKDIGRAHALPEDAGSFSNLQLERLRSRRMIQEKIEECERDICSAYTGECDGQPIRSFRMQSDATSTMLYVQNKTPSSGELHPFETEMQPSQYASQQPIQQQSQCASQQPTQQQLKSQTAQAIRPANKVTSKIVEEAKELLRLFGVPYIDAAGEAEAQCALLEKLKLTEGTITDDSDVWLFGAQNVYRYFFSDDKYVMQYKMTDIEFHVRMTRENLVCFAMLVGSDYTDGIMNIGPVTALEVLSEFQGDNMEPLEKFKNWKVKYDASKDRIPGSKKREKLLKFRLPEEFPSRAVFDGYMRPEADSSTEEFIWGTPELDELREYARRNFGWNSKKIDDKLLPVMKKLSERKTQPTIDTFFFKTAANQNPELFRSKRVNLALNKIAKTTRRKEEEAVVILTEDEDSDNDSDNNEEKRTIEDKVPLKAKGRSKKSSARTSKQADDATRKRRKVKSK